MTLLNTAFEMYLIILMGAFICDMIRPVGDFVRTKAFAPYLLLLPIWRPE